MGKTVRKSGIPCNNDKGLGGMQTGFLQIDKIIKAYIEKNVDF